MAHRGLLSRGRILLLDGGTGEELMKRGLVDDRKTWSALAVSNTKYHDLLYEVHLDFLRAGSDYVTCNNFGITPGVGFDTHSMKQLTRKSGEICRRARDDFEKVSQGRRGKVLGSLPPLVESYRADLVMEHTHGVKVYKECIIDVLDDLVDGWIAETLSGPKECMMALDALGEYYGQQKPCQMKDVFVSMTVKKDGVVRSGHSAGEAVDTILHHVSSSPDSKRFRLMGILFNCSRPEDISLALNAVCGAPGVLERMELSGIGLGAYPNKLTEIPDGWALAESSEPQAIREDIDPEEFVDICMKWIQESKSISILGGCCGIGPEHIRALHQALHDCRN